MLGDIMYGNGCKVDDDPVDWALQQLDKISLSRPQATSFMRYINEVWRPKTPMWCVGARRIPHAGQNTNAAIESYHSNLKSVLHSAKERFVGRRMDWLIYHLTGDVLTHYWYIVQCKAFGFIRNRKQEGIVASAIIRANDIPDTNVLICMDEDVAYVGSVNNRPKVWTIKCPDSEWAQCNCPVAMEGMICKHTVKVFKLLHLGVDDGIIVVRRVQNMEHNAPLQWHMPIRGCRNKLLDSMFRLTWEAPSSSSLWCRIMFFILTLMKNTLIYLI